MFASVPLAVQVAVCVEIGVGTGVLSALFGVGGAVVSTPGIRALGATPFEGIGSTLPSVLPSAISGTLRYHRDGFVRWNVVARVAPWGCAAAIAGAIASVHFPGKGHVQMLLTAALVLYTAIRTAQPTSPTHVDAAAHTPMATWWRSGIIGTFAGLLSGFLGVGGGILMTPTFRGWLKLPLKDTVATSLACVGIIAIPSSITHITQGTVNWIYALPLCVGVIPGARLGAKFAIQASERTLRLVIGWGLGCIGFAYGTAEVIALVS